MNLNEIYDIINQIKPFVRCKMEKFRLCAFADEADKMISGQIAALQGNSMNLIELRGIDGKNVADLTATEARELRKRLDGEGIAV